MIPSPQKCPTCRNRTLVAASVILYETELDHDGRAYKVMVPHLEVRRCDQCGSVVHDDAADERLSDALREVVGLLRPEEIRSKREALGLTQKEMARALSISEFSPSRWETGAQLQQRSMDLLLRLFFDLEAVRQKVGIFSTRSPLTPASATRDVSAAGPRFVGSHVAVPPPLSRTTSIPAEMAPRHDGFPPFGPRYRLVG